MKLIIILIVNSAFLTTGFATGSKFEKSNSEEETYTKSQISIYFGYAFGQTISEVSGKHGSFFGQSSKVSVKGVGIDQNWAAGINVLYYISDYFGFDIDFMYSQATFPEQTVSLNRYSILQPQSDLEFYTISFGPIVRYKGAELWQRMNPFASISLSIPFGSASDVNISPDYGKGGSSSIDGLGFNIQLGTQYRVSNFAFSLAYRFEYLDMTVDHFRSFTQGLNFAKSSSYILLGVCFVF